ncbi:hypothetical protein PBV87_19015 [Niameybacter massiliensis]|uniref:Uncharacterized protein n=1 Tax=Holtiella tumoricola TaxID=3018743 RepID=A0AA42DS42_9FIRM|nr:hypothetical protein [Holtiella tumoricola]MDA3733572.1 hypothetical protein [Holtiella tumoricola]
MKRKLIKQSLILALIFVLFVPSIKATASISNQQLEKSIDKIENIRKQYMSISQNGYINHFQQKSNKSNIDLVHVYISQISDIRTELEEYKKNDLDKFAKRKITTLIAITLYLEDMGQNLIDYLSETKVQDQVDYYDIHLRINSFILSALTNVKDELSLK